jgi:hypothetical protein
MRYTPITDTEYRSIGAMNSKAPQSDQGITTTALVVSQSEQPNGAMLQLLGRLDRIELILQALIQQQTVKDYYTTAEVAQILGKAEFTVREWCRLCRVYAEKRCSGRGRAKEWIISHQELTRIRNEGLLPID